MSVSTTTMSLQSNVSLVPVSAGSPLQAPKSTSEFPRLPLKTLPLPPDAALHERVQCFNTLVDRVLDTQIKQTMIMGKQQWLAENPHTYTKRIVKDVIGLVVVVGLAVAGIAALVFGLGSSPLMLPAVLALLAIGGISLGSGLLVGLTVASLIKTIRKMNRNLPEKLQALKREEIRLTAEIKTFVESDESKQLNADIVNYYKRRLDAVHLDAAHLDAVDEDEEEGLEDNNTDPQFSGILGPISKSLMYNAVGQVGLDKLHEAGRLSRASADYQYRVGLYQEWAKEVNALS